MATMQHESRAVFERFLERTKSLLTLAPKVRRTDLSPFCAQCGATLEDRDLDRGTCYTCRSPAGKIADLNIAIRSGLQLCYGELIPTDDPERISEWPPIRHLMRKRFGDHHSDLALLERCTDWLKEEGLTEEQYLPMPLTYLRWLLANDFQRPEQLLADQKLKALQTIKAELTNWNKDDPFAKTLRAAFINLQPFYGGTLPKPALGHWHNFLKLAQCHVKTDGTSAECEVGRLLEWVNVEIEANQVDQTKKTSTDLEAPKILARPKGHRPARLDESKEDHKPWIDWEKQIFESADGANFGAQKCWDTFKLKLIASGVSGLVEFKALHKRERDKLKSKIFASGKIQ